jgi:regulator of protease activity HflC (stomatin/prohibitin superfamily)
MVVPTTVAFRPRGDKILNLHKILGRDFYESTVRPALLTATRTEFAHRSQEEVIPQAASLQQDILKDLRERLEPYDIEVSSVTFPDLDYPEELAQSFRKKMVTEQEIRNQDSRIELTRKEASVSAARMRGEGEARLAGKEAELAIANKEAAVNAARLRGESEARLAGKEADLANAKREAEIVSVGAQAEVNAVKMRLAVPGYLKLRAIEAQQAMGTNPSTKVLIVTPGGKDGLPLTLHPDLSDRPTRGEK